MNAKHDPITTPWVDPDDAPEWTAEDFANAEISKGGRVMRRGRPPLPNPKDRITIRLDQDVADGLRATGPGWQTRVNDVLKEWLARTGSRSWSEQMEASKQVKSTGMRVVGSRNINIADNRIHGFDDGISVEGSTNLKAFRNTITGSGDPIERKLIEETIALIEAAKTASNVQPNEASAEQAAEESGLKRWMIDNGVSVVALGAQILSLWLGRS